MSCDDNDPPATEGPLPALTLSFVSADATTATLQAVVYDGTHMMLSYAADGDGQEFTAEKVADEGTEYKEGTVTLSGLYPTTRYTVFAVAVDGNGRHGNLERLTFSTEELPDGQMYPWESERGGLLSFSDLALCYGGSPDRVPAVWDTDRFASHVTYTDENNTEHWLFDAFLLIEFRSSGREDGMYYGFAPGHGTLAGGREQWQEIMDYWFDGSYGIAALDRTIEAAAGRLGAAPFRHKIVMMLPDPTIHQTWTNSSSSTKYWGQIDGRTLDFSSAADRIAAHKWYINEVRRRFHQAGYKNVDLAGFYYVPEELVSPGDGWEYNLKKSDQFIPAVAEYLHSVNQSLSWIPYNRSAGYTKQAMFNVDYVYMQPNYFWDNTKSMSQFFSDIETYNLNMEIELDSQMYDGNPGADAFRDRLREYMSGAKTHGVYGTKLLAYYMGENCLDYLSRSTSAKDKAVYHEFCKFVVNNPLRNK